jgi:hypothetical protein
MNQVNSDFKIIWSVKFRAKNTEELLNYIDNDQERIKREGSLNLEVDS